MALKIYRITTTCLLLVLAQFAAFAQEPKENSGQTREWIRAASGNGEFRALPFGRRRSMVYCGNASSRRSE